MAAKGRSLRASPNPKALTNPFRKISVCPAGFARRRRHPAGQWHRPQPIVPASKPCCSCNKTGDIGLLVSSGCRGINYERWPELAASNPPEGDKAG
jgi:hypothetical protein